MLDKIKTYWGWIVFGLILSAGVLIFILLRRSGDDRTLKEFVRAEINAHKREIELQEKAKKKEEIINERLSHETTEIKKQVQKEIADLRQKAPNAEELNRKLDAMDDFLRKRGG